jgi:hypothetical protein
LVAYHTQKKKAIGFLQLVKHSKWLYSIKFAFTNPDFRRMGVATGLFNFAFSIAKKEGGRKIFLNVFPDDTGIIRLYNKLGFEKISNNFEVWGQGQVFNPQFVDTNQLKAIDLNSKRSRNFIFDICQRSMDKKWIDFFEINSNTLMKGFSGDFKRFFNKKAFALDSIDSFCLVFKRPLLKFGFVELFSNKDSDTIGLIDLLLPILSNLGIDRLKMKLFNIRSDSSIQSIKKMGLYRYHSICMGKYI